MRLSPSSKALPRRVRRVDFADNSVLDGLGASWPVLASYLRTASCRVAHDPGALRIEHIYEMPTTRPSGLPDTGAFIGIGTTDLDV